jgi:RecA-family ATPase
MVITDSTVGAWTTYGVPASKLLANPISEIPCLLTPLLPKVGLVCLVGGSDTGKSSFLRNLAMCVASGQTEFLGFHIHAEHNRVIYVTSEDEEMSINCLVNKQNEELGLEPSQLEGLTFVFDTGNLIKKLDEMLSEDSADIVVLDAFGDLFDRGNINDSSHVRLFLNEFSQLAQKHQCLMIFLHHVGKGKEALKPSKHNTLGSQGIEAKMRVVLELVCDQIEANVRHLCIVKGNYLPSEFKNESYKLVFTDNLIFSNTGERVPFTNIIAKENEDYARYEKAKGLRDKGMKLEDIADVVGYANKGNVSKLLKKYEESN